MNCFYEDFLCACTVKPKWCKNWIYELDTSFNVFPLRSFKRVNRFNLCPQNCSLTLWLQLLFLRSCKAYCCFIHLQLDGVWVAYYNDSYDHQLEDYCKDINKMINQAAAITVDVITFVLTTFAYATSSSTSRLGFIPSVTYQ